MGKRRIRRSNRSISDTAGPCSFAPASDFLAELSDMQFLTAGLYTAARCQIADSRRGGASSARTRVAVSRGGDSHLGAYALRRTRICHRPHMILTWRTNVRIATAGPWMDCLCGINGAERKTAEKTNLQNRSKPSGCSAPQTKQGERLAERSRDHGKRVLLSFKSLSRAVATRCDGRGSAGTGTGLRLVGRGSTGVCRGLRIRGCRL